MEEALRSTGRTCTWLRWHEAQQNRRGPDEWNKHHAWLAKHLKTLQNPSPCSCEWLFGSRGNGNLRAVGARRVPQEVAVVGVADSL